MPAQAVERVFPTLMAGWSCTIHLGSTRSANPQPGGFEPRFWVHHVDRHQFLRKNKPANYALDRSV